MNLITKENITIGTGQYFLREITPGDAAGFQIVYEELDSSGFYYAYLKNMAAEGEKTVGLRFVEKAIAAQSESPRQTYRYALCSPNGQIVGSCVLLLDSNDHNDSRLENGAEIGFFIAPSHQRRNLSTDSAKVLIQLARQLGKVSVWAKAHPKNAASIRVLEKLGMTLIDETFSTEDNVAPERLLYIRHF